MDGHEVRPYGQGDHGEGEEEEFLDDVSVFRAVC